jgi:hypothetical protein
MRQHAVERFGFEPAEVVYIDDQALFVQVAPKNKRVSRRRGHRSSAHYGVLISL